MWRAIICLSAALILGVPNLAAAQYSTDADRQNPAEYTDEDSQPLRMIAFLVAPIGFVAEWTIARPLHYIATNTFLAPVFNGDTREPEYKPPAIAEIPLDNVGDEPPRPSTFSYEVSPESSSQQTTPLSPGPGASKGAGGASQPMLR
jgi:hypothetical protein